MKIRKRQGYYEVFCSWWPLPGFTAITLYPFIFYKGIPSLKIQAHELVHIRQVKAMGCVRFYLTYLLYWIRYGYADIPFEVEAYTDRRVLEASSTEKVKL